MRRATTRTILWAAAVVGVVALVAGTWWAATAFVSPAQRDAAAAAPEALPVLASAERGDLIDERTVPAQIRPKQEQTLPLLGPGDAERTVLTAVNAAVGSTVNVGDSPASVNGQPLVMLESSFPMYRDLGPGDRGPDVKALQSNLVDLGLLSGVDGVFGTQTTRALTALYKRLGETAPTREVTVAETEGDETSPSPQAETYLPVWATLSAPEVPVVVAAAPTVGAPIGESTSFSVRSSSVDVVATIPDSSMADFVAGLPAMVTVAGASPVAGRVGTVTTTTTEGQSVTTAIIDVDDPSLISPDLVGQNVSVMVRVRVLAEDALIVPLLAVADQGDGTGIIQIEDAGADAFVAVSVKIMATLNGRVAISADTAVQEGSEVRVG